GQMLLEVHGQHETVGLLDPRTHRPLLDAYGELSTLAGPVAGRWGAWRAAEDRAASLREVVAKAAAETEELTFRLEELDRLDPREGEEAELAEARAVLGASEKALGDIAQAREGVEGLGARLAQAVRALERARERAVGAGAAEDGSAVSRLVVASAAVDRALVEA